MLFNVYSTLTKTEKTSVSRDMAGIKWKTTRSKFAMTYPKTFAILTKANEKKDANSKAQLKGNN